MCFKRCHCDCVKRDIKPKEVEYADKRDQAIRAWQAFPKNPSKKPEEPHTSSDEVKRRAASPEPPLLIDIGESETTGSDEETATPANRAIRAWQDFAKNPSKKPEESRASSEEVQRRAESPEPPLLIDMGSSESTGSNEEAATPADGDVNMQPPPGITSVMERMTGKDGHRTRWTDIINWSEWHKEKSVVPLTNMEPSLLD